jgi:uncharacterized membrane protein
MTDTERTTLRQALTPLVEVSEAQRERESRHARVRELQAATWQKQVRRMFLQCFLLMFLGVPLYLLAWRLTDPAQAQLVVAAAFVVSYVAPLGRMLVFHVRATARADY